MENTFNDNILLITGGTGSFGNMMLKRMLKTNIKQIRIFSRDETKQHFMSQLYKDKRIKYFIGDVKDVDSMKIVMKDVDYIFHAAALKQVPSAQQFPYEYIKTNILGSHNVIRTAIQNKVKKVVLLSTDKSVYPINTMGMTKALMQKLSKISQGTDTTVCITRYGNVLNSRGSVIPVFKQQIKLTNTLLVTNPQMTRYLMSLQEAIELVLFALKNGSQSEIYVQKSPASNIMDLAIAFKQLYGNDQTSIEIIGSRPGQKLHQTLINRQQFARVTDLGNYYCINPQQNVKELDFEYNSNTARKLEMNEIIQILRGIENNQIVQYNQCGLEYKV